MEYASSTIHLPSKTFGDCQSEFFPPAVYGSQLIMPKAEGCMHFLSFQLVLICTVPSILHPIFHLHISVDR